MSGLVIANRQKLFICAVVFSVDVPQLKAFVASADVTTERVHTLTKPRTRGLPRHTLVHIDTRPAVRSETQSWRRTLTSDLAFHHRTAVLTVSHRTRMSVATRAISHHHVAVETVAFVTARCVHTPVLTRPERTLVHILVAGLAGISWMTAALIQSNTLAVFTARLTHGSALAL